MWVSGPLIQQASAAGLAWSSSSPTSSPAPRKPTTRLSRHRRTAADRGHVSIQYHPGRQLGKAPARRQDEAPRQCHASMVLVLLPSSPDSTMHPRPGLLLIIDSFVISIFAIIILSTLGFLFKANHPELVGGDEDPSDGAKVAATVFTAVFIYAVGFPSCPMCKSRARD